MRALLALAALSLSPLAMTDDDAGPEIALSPIPPHRGGKLTIGYTGPLPVTIKLSWDPVGTPASVTLTTDAPSVEITVPSNATSLIAHDASGAAPDEPTVVIP